jgi:hypothetical protein
MATENKEEVLVAMEGDISNFVRAFDGHQAAGLALIGRSDAEAGGACCTRSSIVA